MSGSNGQTSPRLVISTGNFVFQRSDTLRSLYKVGEKLGDGAFGTVRKVTHRETKQVRAVKVVSKKVLNTPEKSAWFTNEVAVLKILDHPNIIRLFESFEDTANFYMVTECCEGGELYESLVRMGYMTEVQAAEYMRQLLSCIAYCHDKGVIHRDLKLDNFLLESTTPGALLKVIDFGTAAFWTPGQRFAEKCGTPYYIAPEVLKRNYTEKCDLWSLGVCLYILLCGSPPFPGTSDEQILRKVVKGQFEFPSPEWDLVSYEAKDLTCRLLTLDPDLRISAREALSHPWFENASNGSLHPTHACLAFENMRRFATKMTLQKATMTLITVQMCSKAEREDMELMFRSLDRDHTGTLSREELVQGFSLLFGRDMEDVAEEVDHIMKAVDSDQSGEIDYTEFISATLTQRLIVTQERLLRAFQAFDLDGNGLICADELRSVLSGGRVYDESVWENLIKEADQNGDGAIDFQEFTQMMQHLSG